MTLNEIEKLREIYSDLKKLWMTDVLIKYSAQPLQSLSEVLEAAVLDRHNAAVEAESVVHKNTVMIELPIKDVEFYANQYPLPMSDEADYMNARHTHACRKALEQIK